MTKKQRTRNWAFVIYPESAPSSWREMLSELHIPAFVSPLHDRDLDKEGNPKKAHHHVVLMFDGPVTQHYANSVIDSFNGTKSAEYVRSIKAYARYLVHMDDPEKAQYDMEGIESYSGADLEKVLNASNGSKYSIVADIMEYCEENGVTELCDLVSYARKEHLNDWMPVLMESAYLMSQYLMSLRFKLKA